MQNEVIESLRHTGFLCRVGVLCLAAALWGCNAGEIVPEDEEQTPIAFVADDARGAGTRATASATNNFPDGTQMGLFAYYTPAGSTLDTGVAPNFMNNQAVTAHTERKSEETGDGGDGQPTSETIYTTTWSYSPVKYWPGTEGDCLSFFGYYPWVDGATESNVTYPLDGTQDIRWINQVNGNEVATDDNGTATVNPENVTTYAECPDGSVSLNFRHKLMRLQFKFLATPKVADAENGFERLPWVEKFVVKPAAGAVLKNTLTFSPLTGGVTYSEGSHTDGFLLSRNDVGEETLRFQTYATEYSAKDFVQAVMYIDPLADDENAAETDQVKSLSLDINLEGMTYTVGVTLKSPKAGKSYLMELTFSNDTHAVTPVITLTPWETHTTDTPAIIR